MTDKQIEILQNQVTKIDEKDFDLDAWKSETCAFLGRIFGDNYQGIQAIERIKNRSVSWRNGNTSSRSDKTASFKKQSKDILNACITELQIFGQPEQKDAKNSGININLTQNQNQTVNINLLISALEDELTVSQLREVNDLMKTEEPKNRKTKSRKKLLTNSKVLEAMLLPIFLQTF